MTFRATRDPSSRRWRIAALAAFLVVLLIAGALVYDFLGSDLGGWCPNGEGVFPRDCPDKYSGLPSPAP